MAVEVANMPFWWGNDFSLGVFLFFLGVSGAGIMVYLGEWDKLIGNSARILEIEELIESKKEMVEELKGLDPVDKEQMWDSIRRNEEMLYREVRFFRVLGVFLYLFIGGIIAAILADDALKAVAFGAGWTGFLGVFGIKRDDEQRKALRDKKYEEARKEALQDFEDKLREMKNKTEEVYFRGYEEAINDIAKNEGKTFDEILEKLP